MTKKKNKGAAKGQHAEKKNDLIEDVHDALGEEMGREDVQEDGQEDGQAWERGKAVKCKKDESEKS